MLNLNIIALFLALFSAPIVNTLHATVDGTLGTPYIINYEQDQYRGGTQTWDIALADGYTFFGNNDGLLVYDGDHFTHYPLPNRTIVRSVMVQGKHIYVGGQNEFGFFKLQSDGQLAYTSLSDSLSEEVLQRIADVWSIHWVDSSLVFQSDHHLIAYKNNRVHKIITVDPIIIKASSFNNRLFWYTDEQSLFQWENHAASLVTNLKSQVQITPSYIYPKSTDSIIISTLYQGFFLYDGERLQSYFDQWDPDQQVNIYTATFTNQHWYLGTTQNGIYVLNKSGEIVNQFNTQNGLQNNTVLSLAIDAYSNVWAGLDRGIDFIPTSSPFHISYPDGTLRGTGYAALEYEGSWWLGTNNGLFEVNTEQSHKPTFIEGSSGQVWHIQAIDDQLYISHHKGLFQWVNNALIPISPTSGSWLLREIPGTDWVVEGTYEGINLYQKGPGGLQYKKQLQGFKESARYISIEPGRIWVAHPYKGLFRLEIDDALNLTEQAVYRSDNGQGQAMNLFTFPLVNETVFTGEQGIYQYRSASDTFVIHPDFASYFDSSASIQFIREGARGNIWFVNNGQVGFLEIEETSLNKTITKHLLPALPRSLTRGFEFLYAGAHMLVLPVEEGFIVVDRQRLAALDEMTPRLSFSRLTAHGRSDTLIQLGFGYPNRSIELPASYFNITVHFATDNPALSGIVEYQHRLVGAEDEWSQWSTENDLSYNYLQPDRYRLEVRSRVMNQISEPIVLTIHITQPWYQTTPAIVGFLILVGLLLLGIAFIPSIRFRSEKRKLEYKKVKEIRAKEQQFQSKFAETQEKIDKLQTEKMQADLNHQAKELASATMHLVQKGEMLTKIKENLTEVNKIVADPNAKKQIKSMIRSIEADVNFDETWKNFEHQFDKVHVNFTQRLKEEYPSLTPNDIKLCTYLKLNLTSKEIATLTNISVRGVEISRYRLRKKLGLESHENLVEFIQAI